MLRRWSIGHDGDKAGWRPQSLGADREIIPIFFAVSDRDWILDGASLRICMVGFGSDRQTAPPILDGQEVPLIRSDLRSGSDLSLKKILTSNVGRCFMGMTKVGDFDIKETLALKFLTEPNPHGRPNSDVLRPFRNGSDVVRTCSNRWIIDFGTTMPEVDAALYAAPFEYLSKHVKPDRLKNARTAYRQKWWIHAEARPGLRRAMLNLSRYAATARVAKHRVFVWLDSVILPDSKIIAIAFDDDFSLGVLQSRVHGVWSLGNCGWHGGERGTYNPTTCFETFPFPEPTEPLRIAIAQAAKRLDELRSNWLHPPEWHRQLLLEFRGAMDGPWGRYVHDPDSQGIGTERYPRLIVKDSHVYELDKRTLTNLYNERPTWLDLAHKALDEAVFDAYGWTPSMTNEEILSALLELNLERAGSSSPVDEETGQDDQTDEDT